MTLDASGNLLVGTTSALSVTSLAKVNIAASSAGVSPLKVANTNASNSSVGISSGSLRGSTNAYYLFSGYYGDGSSDAFSSTCFYVAGNGGIGNIQANDVNLSDLDVKTDFKTFKASGYSTNSWQFMKDMEDAWGRFKYVDQEHDDFNNGYGAQLVKIAAEKNGFNELVEHEKWGKDQEIKDEEGNVVEVKVAPMRYQVYDNDLMHIVGEVVTQLTHKVDALIAENTELKARLDAAGL